MPGSYWSLCWFYFTTTLGHRNAENCHKDEWNIPYYVLAIVSASALILCHVSILVSTAISVDRLLALLLGLRYRHFVTLRRVCVLLTCLWLTAISIVLMNNFWNNADPQFAVLAAITIGTLSLVISIFSYTSIFFKLRRQQAQAQDLHQRQPNGERIPLNIARYKKTVSSICSVRAVSIGCLLCSVYYFFFINNDNWLERTKFNHRLDICSNSFSLKLVSKPNSLLLEDKRSKTSSEGHSKKVLLFCLSSTDNHTQLSEQSWQVTLTTFWI